MEAVEIERRCVVTLSSFLDDLEAFENDFLTDADGNHPHLHDRGGVFEQAWLGAGATGAELCPQGEEDDIEMDSDDDDFDLILHNSELDDDRAIASRCTVLRHTILVATCSTLLPRVQKVHLPPEDRTKMRSLSRLASSQTTRECWLYPLRFCLPHGPLNVAQRLVDIMRAASEADTVVTSADHVSDVERLIASATCELVFSPARILEKVFPLYEALVQGCVTCTRLRVAVTFRGLRPNDPALLDAVVNAVNGLKLRLALVFSAAGGSETHWLYLVCLVDQLLQSVDSDTGVVGTVWRVLWSSLKQWLAMSVSLSPTGLPQDCAMTGLQVSLRSISREQRQLLLAETEAAMIIQHKSVHLNILRVVDHVSHLAVLPFPSRQPLLSMYSKAYAEVLQKAQSLILPRNWSPAAPSWLHTGARYRACVDCIGWSSAMGCAAEFASLAPSRARVTAEKVITLRALVSSSPAHKEAFYQFFSETAMFRKFMSSLAAQEYIVRQQLDHRQQLVFLNSLVPFLLGDVDAAPSPDLFDTTSYGLLMDYFTNVVPLQWSLESIQRLVTFVDDPSITLLSSIENSLALHALFTSVCQCVLEALIRLRTTFESGDDEERIAGSTCFSSDDVDIFGGFLDVLHRLMLLEQPHETPATTGIPSMEQPPVVAARSVDNHLPPSDMWGSVASDSFNSSAWNISTVAPNTDNNHVTPLPTHEPALPREEERLPRSSNDMFLLQPYILWVSWIANDVLIPPSHTDYTAPVLSSDASMHDVIGKRVGWLIRQWMDRTVWSVATTRGLTSLLGAFIPQQARASDVAGRIVLNEVMRSGLQSQLSRGVRVVHEDADVAFRTRGALERELAASTAEFWSVSDNFFKMVSAR